MQLWEAILLGIIEGFTEFLPISSTAHLTITEKLLGYRIDEPSVTAFTAIIQAGAVAATLLYFRRDLWHIFTAWLQGVRSPAKRQTRNYRFGWAIILGSIPIGITGLLFKDEIETTLRSLWFVSISLIAWSGVMWLAEKRATQTRHEADVTWRDTLLIGLAQCLALIPGVSRSGATTSIGLLRGIDRVAVTRLAFFLSIPALTAAAILQITTRYQDIAYGVGWPATIAATIASFIVAYVAVAWLLKFIASHSYRPFIIYRLVLGSVIFVLLLANTISAK